jgi:hypothetical protein
MTFSLIGIILNKQKSKSVRSRSNGKPVDLPWLEEKIAEKNNLIMVLV